MKQISQLCVIGRWLLVLAGANSLAAGEPFVLATRPVEVAENGFVTNLVLYTARHEFSFLPPANWKMGVNTNEATVAWESSDLSSLISLKTVFSNNGRAPAISAAQLRPAIREHFAGARIVEEFVAYTGSGEGLAFDLEYVLAGRFRMNTRLAYVPFNGGLVEFNLTAPTDKFAQHQRELGLLLNSFRADERQRR